MRLEVNLASAKVLDKIVFYLGHDVLSGRAPEEVGARAAEAHPLRKVSNVVNVELPVQGLQLGC